MITSRYANNFRCLVGFETNFSSFGVLCGPNGAGKSAVFDVIRLIWDLATGDSYLGGVGERDIAALEFTNWFDGTATAIMQLFEQGKLRYDDSIVKYLSELPQSIRLHAWITCPYIRQTADVDPQEAS